MQDEVSKALEAVGEWGMAKRSGAAWGNGGIVRRTLRRLIHPWAGIQLGILDDRVAQAKIMAEQWLAAGPSANMPRLRPQDGSWAALCYSYPSGVGAMTWLSNYYTLGSLIEPEDWRRRAVLLEWQAFAGMQVAIFVPGPNGSVTKEAMRGAQRRTLVANDYRGVYLDQPINKPDGVFELGISVA